MNYQKICNVLWNDPRFRGLSPDAQRFYLYLRTNELNNIIGTYTLRPGAVCDDLGCKPRQVEKWIRVVLGADLISYDPAFRLVIIHDQLVDNPITNRNQIIFAMKLVKIIESEEILNKLHKLVSTSKVLRKGLSKYFAKSLGDYNLSFSSFSTKDYHSTSLLPSRSTTGSTKEKQCDSEPTKGEEREEWGDDVLKEIQNLHLKVFGYVIKPKELADLSVYSPDRVVEKYREAVDRVGSSAAIRYFSWILNGLNGSIEKPGFLKRFMLKKQNPQEAHDDNYRYDH